MSKNRTAWNGSKYVYLCGRHRFVDIRPVGPHTTVPPANSRLVGLTNCTAMVHSICKLVAWIAGRLDLLVLDPSSRGIAFANN
jgi:hypothetical protein